METYALKPCPFCGGFAIPISIKTHIYNGEEVPIVYYIRCTSCKAKVGFPNHYSHTKETFLDEESAVEAWNKRKNSRCETCFTEEGW